MSEYVALGSLDALTAVIDDALRAAGLGGANCVQVLDIDGHIDVERLRSAAGRLAERHPLTTARLYQRWWTYWPRWQLLTDGRIPVEVVDATDEADPANLAERCLREYVDPREDPPVRLLLARGREGQDVLVMRWSHVLTDARGADMLMRVLGEEYGQQMSANSGSAGLRPEPLRLERRRVTRFRPVRDPLVIRLANGTADPRPQVAVRVLSEEESRRVREAAIRVAGFGRMPMFVMAAFLRALGQACRRMGQVNGVVATWWPFGLREGARPTALPGNEFGVLRTSCSISAPPLRELVERVAQDVVSQMASGDHLFQWRVGSLLKLARFADLCRVNRRFGILSRGMRVSAQFRFGGRMLGGQNQWGGLPVVSSFSAAACLPASPVAFGLSQAVGRFQVVTTWLDGALGDDAREHVVTAFVAELTGCAIERRD